MDLQNLDDETRIAMAAEYQRDVDGGDLYYGRRLNATGIHRWPVLLLEALRFGDPASLAGALRAESTFVDTEMSQRNGKPYAKRVPTNAADTLAEGEFVRFYMRAICVRAAAIGAKVQVYRAKGVNEPRPESGLKIGQVLDPLELLEDLRSRIGTATLLGVPAGPNSGLCVRLT